MKPSWAYGLFVCFCICLIHIGTRGAGQNAVNVYSIAVDS